MFRVEFSVKLPFKVKKKRNLYISSCNVLDIHSQGYSEAEAKQNIKEAVRLFITTSFEMGTLDSVLKQCGFQARKVTLKALKPIKDHGFITVPIPFNAKGVCLSECRA